MMIDIIAISDEEVYLTNKDKKKFDLLICGGDLSPQYMDYVINEFKPSLSLMVHGNHDKKYYKLYEEENNSFSKVYKGAYILNHGIVNLKKFIGKDIIVAGFSGALAHGYRPFYFKESDINKFKREILFNTIFKGGKNKQIDIMITHNPPYIKNTIKKYGQSHTPSRALGEFYLRALPKIWIYGHIHPRYHFQELDFEIKFLNNVSYLINAVPYKLIKYNDEKKEIIEIRTYKKISTKTILI
ncbi:metallophosphoesterase family protein [Petrotoga olearia]|uniref:Calcineurin-like phosphoesterase domain-containing protein n=2 Tax=Petrotoga olearia TaxID=156203 RepID=A0A2K1NYQ2_9BACT|nr:metallophosphoesterase [Petrotoga olearia]PNR95678.1 hypothetical protein X929_07195 [Petrotoga olearia DSM 13574]